MRRIVSLIDHELNLTQRSLKSDFELKFGEEVVGTLHFPSMLSTRAEAISGDGKWIIERRGVFKMQTVVTSADSGQQLCTCKGRGWKGGFVVEFPNGKKHLVNANVWKNTLEFQTETGESLLLIATRGVFKTSVSLSMQRRALKEREFPMVVFLGMHLAIMRRRDATHHVAVG